MRDIRKDLEERLQQISNERTRLDAELQKLIERENTIGTLLAEENDRWKESESLLLLGDSPICGTPLTRFVLDILSDGMVRRTEDIMRLVQENNIPLNPNSPRRAMNLSLINMQRKHLVDMVETGAWKITKNKEE